MIAEQLEDNVCDLQSCISLVALPAHTALQYIGLLAKQTMSEPESPRTPVGEGPDSQESYMARSLSTTQVTKHRRDRTKKHDRTKGSRLGKLDETMMKRTHSVSSEHLR